MSQDRNIVHQYFKRTGENTVILVKVNPIQFHGTELTISDDGKTSRRDLEFDEEILDDLLADGFEPASALEFNLHQAGLV
jgi:hypothetical protein